MNNDFMFLQWIDSYLILFRLGDRRFVIWYHPLPFQIVKSWNILSYNWELLSSFLFLYRSSRWLWIDYVVSCDKYMFKNLKLSFLHQTDLVPFKVRFCDKKWKMIKLITIVPSIINVTLPSVCIWFSGRNDDGISPKRQWE